MTTSAKWELLAGLPAMHPAAPLALAGALVLAGGRSVGRLGLRTADEAADSDAAIARPAWIAVAMCAVAALAWAAGGGPPGAVVGAIVAGAAGWALRHATRAEQDTDPAALAAAWELLAVCLQAGLPVATAVAASAAGLDGDTGERLRRVAGLLALGADPASAWRGIEHRPALATFARAACRSAGTGAALAQVARAEAERVRSVLLDAAEARAQRAAVLIAGPLGLCFLPAFLVLGIAPVVIGLASEALARW
jgi:pilus assembly protein TadC